MFPVYITDCSDLHNFMSLYVSINSHSIVLYYGIRWFMTVIHMYRFNIRLILDVMIFLCFISVFPSDIMNKICNDQQSCSTVLKFYLRFNLKSIVKKKALGLVLHGLYFSLLWIEMIIIVIFIQKIMNIFRYKNECIDNAVIDLSHLTYIPLLMQYVLLKLNFIS